MPLLLVIDNIIIIPEGLLINSDCITIRLLVGQYNMTSGQEESATTTLDEDTIQWRKILDLDSAAKLEIDWYSTKTFEVFLDALDINQPTTIRPKQSSKEILKENSPCKEAGPVEKKEPKNLGEETILSAEALKILSELPDLSHMSSTRSFMFPGRN